MQFVEAVVEPVLLVQTLHPTEQFLHVVAPGNDHLPSPQLAQEAFLTTLLYLFAAQGLHAALEVEPVLGLYLPLPQFAIVVVHVFTLLQYAPLGQVVQLAAFAAEYLPVPQLVQAVQLAYCPQGQALHCDAAVAPAGEPLPAAQHL